jgi:hypothetical protein
VRKLFDITPPAFEDALERAVADDSTTAWAPPGATSHVVDAEPYGLSAGGATLVRPDGVVAWRARGPVGRDELARALTTALALPPGTPAAGG